jgi:hypothetical protein
MNMSVIFFMKSWAAHPRLDLLAYTPRVMVLRPRLMDVPTQGLHDATPRMAILAISHARYKLNFGARPGPSPSTGSMAERRGRAMPVNVTSSKTKNAEMNLKRFLVVPFQPSHECSGQAVLGSQHHGSPE